MLPQPARGLTKTVYKTYYTVHFPPSRLDVRHGQRTKSNRWHEICAINPKSQVWCTVHVLLRGIERQGAWIYRVFRDHGPHLIHVIVVIMNLIVWNWIHLGVRFYSHFATLASQFQPKYNDWARDRYSKYDERRKDMAQLQSPSRVRSWPCPLFCPILISSHIIRHLGVNASLQPPSNCHVEVPLHVSSDYQISSIIQFSTENWILLKIGWFYKHYAHMQRACSWKLKCCGSTKQVPLAFVCSLRKIQTKVACRSWTKYY